MRKMNRILGASLVATATLTFAAGAHAAAPTQLDHYLCYKGALSKGESKFVNPFPTKTLIDQFEDRTYNIKNPTWHCNPARKTYLGVTEQRVFPDIHLEGYPIALTVQDPRQVEVKPSNRITVDQFGALYIVVKKPESLDLRTSKTNLGPYPFVSCSPSNPCFSGVCQPASGGYCLPTTDFPPPPANDDSVDNFKCYKIGLQKGFKFTKIVGQVGLSDQFWTPVDTFDILKPTRLCAPVDKNGENPDAPGHPGHLVCYKIKLSKTTPPAKPDTFPKFKVADSNGNLPDNRLDVKTVKELCVPAKKITCGDGVVDQPYEDCDVPGNTTQCPGGGTCSADCRCPVVTGCYDYHGAGAFLDMCVSMFGATCASMTPAPLLPDVPSGTTFQLCTSDPDTAGRRALTVDPATWFADASFGNTDLTATVRLCPTAPMTGVLFTTATNGSAATASYPNQVCLAGDGAKLRMSCSADGQCDGPGLTTGNGLCGTRDLDYTSQTTDAGTAVTYGNGIADKAGSALFTEDLRADTWLGYDARCTGDGINASCVACDDVTPAPAGRIGIDLTVTGGAAPDVVFPLDARYTTGSAENKVVQGGNVLYGREVLGNGQPSSGASLLTAGGNAQLNIPTTYGPAHIQFFGKQALSPVVP